MENRLKKWKKAEQKYSKYRKNRKNVDSRRYTVISSRLGWVFSLLAFT
jgi:hypothetical protein